MLHTAELDMADSVVPNDGNVFLDNAAWAICSTYHTVLKASDMLFNILFVADWSKIEEQRQSLTNLGNQHENAKQIDYDYKVGDKVLVINEGILRKAESTYSKEPLTITLRSSLMTWTDRNTDRETNTLAARGLEELRANLLLKENSYMSYIILHQSLILEL
jgi:hypothetical protein